MEENKFETAKVALEKKFEFEPIEKKISELGWDKDWFARYRKKGMWFYGLV